MVAGTVQDPLGRRILLAEINSLTAIFILIGQLTVTVSSYCQNHLFLITSFELLPPCYLELVGLVNCHPSFDYTCRKRCA